MCTKKPYFKVSQTFLNERDWRNCETNKFKRVCNFERSRVNYSKIKPRVYVSRF